MDAQSRAIIEIFGEATVGVDSADLKEAFFKVQALLGREDQGWTSIFGAGADPNGQFGLTLLYLREWGWKIRESIVGAPWIGRGFRLRANYIWKDGIRYGNIPGSASVGGTRGKTNIQDLIDQPGNQRSFFGISARRQREEKLYSEGIALWIGNDSTKTLEAIPLWQITQELLNTDGLGEIMAYRRQWVHRDLNTGEGEERVAWYFTDAYADMRVPTIKVNGTDEPVAMGYTIFDQHANRPAGLAYGSPDAVAALVWNGIAREATMDGRAMTKALATFALKASVKTKEAGQQGAIQLASPHGAGSTLVVGQANDLVPMATAGKGYDFDSIQFLVAIVAASLDVSVIHLTADPSSAGSSYGSAQTLDLPTRLAMEARRAEHVELDERVLRWMGVTDPEVSFIPYDAGDEVYRTVQSLIMSLDNDLYTRQEIRDLLDDLMGRADGTVPTDDQRPSVLLAKTMAQIQGAVVATTDTAKNGDGVTKTTTSPQAANPAQGKSNGTGGQGGGNASNDIRRGKK